MPRRCPGAADVRDVLESRAGAGGRVPEDHARTPMWILRHSRFNFWIHAAGYVDHIGAAVEVEIRHARTPFDEAIFDRQAGARGDILEEKAAEVVIQRGDVIG